MRVEDALRASAVAAFDRVQQRDVLVGEILHALVALAGDSDIEAYAREQPIVGLREE
jgi:hypothetical protein